MTIQEWMQLVARANELQRELFRRRSEAGSAWWAAARAELERIQAEANAADVKD